MPSSRRLHIDTQLIHGGEPRPRLVGAVSLPIFQSSTYESQDESSYHEIRYMRLNNSPNHLALHEKLRVIEGAEAALVAASGMAAITTTLLSLLKAGDHVIAARTLYGGTLDFLLKDLPPLDIADLS
jgi:cystathionine beta-lyase/cystathionine gamma-synthase